MEGFYFETKEDALKKVLEILPKDKMVSCGGSATLHEIGLKVALKDGGYNFLDPDDAILRAKKYSAPTIMLKFKRDYSSFDELSKAAEGACSHLVITSMSTNKDRIKVLLVGECLVY